MLPAEFIHPAPAAHALFDLLGWSAPATMAFINAVGVGAVTRPTLANCRHRPAHPVLAPPSVAPAQKCVPRMVVDDDLPSTTPVPAVAVPKSVGIGVIGCGRIGQVHARAITSLPGAHLAGVADPFEPFGLAVASEFSTTWTGDWRELVNDAAVDAVVIGSPTPFHAEQILACAAAGKAIFCEKPISNDLATIDECIHVRVAARMWPSRVCRAVVRAVGCIVSVALSGATPII